jgi:indole-3-glycerol phosphate synthase
MDTGFHTKFQEILDDRERYVKEQYASGRAQELIRIAPDYRSKRDFYEAVSGPGMKLIAEIKKKSPSKGLIRKDADPETISLIYQVSGAEAMSVLTNPFFDGSMEDLAKVSRLSRVPVLDKEFVVDYCQIAEARVAGADAVLLIVAPLEGNQLPEYIDATRQLGMDPLVEVHDIEDLERALRAGVDIIGVNNRDLRTFETDLSTTRNLLPYISEEYTVVTESGIITREDVLYLSDPKVSTMLVGERLMSQELNPTLYDIKRTIHMLKGEEVEF